MKTAITFLGAARNVTGSRYLLESGNSHILVDCGLHQERDYRGRDWEPFAFPPDRIDAVVLTHAHLDHCGFLPKLVADGFSGAVYCTPASADIVEIVLRDAAHIMAEDAKHKRRRHAGERRSGPRSVEPLYDLDDVKQAIPLIAGVPVGEPFEVVDGVEACFHEAGHILGSAMVRFELSGSGSVLFSGDIGRWDKPILNDPDVFESADVVIMESTYGDRVHEDPGDILDLLADAVETANSRGGNLVIPSFAIALQRNIEPSC